MPQNTTKTVTSASGYRSIAETPLGSGVIFAGQIRDRNWETDFIPLVANTSTLSELIECGQIMEFTKPAKVGPWRRYEKNQTMIPDQISPDSFCITICESSYKSLKFDKLDVRQACEHWDEFESSFLEDTWRQLSDLWHISLLSGMQLSASARNTGRNAGRYRNIDLGTQASPLQLTPENIITFISKVKELFVQCGRWYDGNMFMIVPIGFESLILQTVYNKQWCCNQEESVLVKGFKAENLQGFKMIETDRIEPVIDPDSGQLIHTLLFGWDDAYAFSGDVVEADIVDMENSFGMLYKMLTVYGGGVIHPEGLGKAQVILSTDNVARLPGILVTEPQ